MQPLETAVNEEVSVQLRHESMDIRIGYPAILSPGDSFPDVILSTKSDGIASVFITSLPSGEIAASATEQEYRSNEPRTIEIQGEVPQDGPYEIRVELVTAAGDRIVEWFTFTALSEFPKHSSGAAFTNDEGRMVYLPDYRGNRLPDFSGVGYMGGGVELPQLQVKATLEPAPGDNTSRIQEAIDRVSELQPDANGFRGAVLLKKGIYEIAGVLEIRTSGVVLRGEGQGDMEKLWYDPKHIGSLEELKTSLASKDATVLIATGSERRRVLKFHGTDDVRIPKSESSEIVDRYVPVGANSFHVANPDRFQVGDTIILQRSGNAAWIHEIGMDRIPDREDGSKITQWSPFELHFEHVITAIEGSRITVDSSMMNAVESRWGGGRIYKFEDPGRISQIGLENLRGIAFWTPNGDGVDDTRHANEFVELDNCKNGWVRNVTLEHFNSTNGAYRTGRGSKWITIQDSSNLIADKAFYNGKGYDPTGRTFYETNIYVGRYGFYLNGQSALVTRCFALNNRHGFTLGSRVTGPNVFHECVGEQPLTWSEPHHRWSVGGLYDNVHDMISLMNRLNMGSGHGWAGANYIAWNTEGTLVCHQPPTAQNWSIGHIGKKDVGGNRGPDGYWDSHGQHVEPKSLFTQQLKDRLGK